MQIIFESQPDKSKSYPANTKVSRQLAGQKGYDDHPEEDTKGDLGEYVADVKKT